MDRGGFIITCAAAIFSVLLLSWYGYQGFSSDWIYGFLAVLWSTLMIMRLGFLTTAETRLDAMPYLAQKIIQSFRETREKRRQEILERSFNGSYILFLIAAFSYAAWQVYCAAFPAQNMALDSLNTAARQFFIQGGSEISLVPAKVFNWGQGFLLLLSLVMMGFVLRSYAMDLKMARSALLILCGYAVAGFIAFAGLDPGTANVLPGAELVGNGAGSLPYFAGDLGPDKSFSIFDIILVESGIAGLAILTFLTFIPLGYICLSAQGGRADWMVITCGMVAGAAMICSMFLTFTPAIGGFFAVCWMAVFLAWGAAENNFKSL